MPDVPIRITDHAAWQLARRELDRADILEVVSAPQQTVPIRPGREIRQSLTLDGRYVIRVIVDVAVDEVTVVTMYRSSKIDRYWQK